MPGGSLADEKSGSSPASEARAVAALCERRVLLKKADGPFLRQGRLRPPLQLKSRRSLPASGQGEILRRTNRDSG